MKRIRSWIFGLLLALLFAEVWLGFPIRLENQDVVQPPPELSIDPQEAQQIIKGFHLVESRGGDRDWELFADKAEGYEGRGKWQLKKVKILFYLEKKIQFTVTGREAEFDTKTKDMKIEGDVRTLSANGYQFESNLMLYLSKARTLQSPSKVRMTGPADSQGPGMTVTSDYMRALLDKSEMTLEGHVSAQKKLKSGQKVQIQSERGQFSGANWTALFQEQVVIEYNSMKMESPEASFQYKSTSSLLESIQMNGGVRINDLDKSATADLVRIEPETNRIVLSGQPRVVQDQDELLGDQIVFIDGGKKVKIEKMRARVEKAPGEQ